MAADMRLRQLLADARGLTTVEYVIVLVLIAAAAVSSWRLFGESVQRHLGRANTSIRDSLVEGKEEP
jgi:Flp pilus assembly pilin Flp